MEGFEKNQCLDSKQTAELIHGRSPADIDEFDPDHAPTCNNASQSLPAISQDDEEVIGEFQAMITLK